MDGSLPYRGPEYLRHVLETGVGSLQQVRPLLPAPQVGDVDAQLQFWTTAQRSLAAAGYDPQRLTDPQLSEIEVAAERSGSAAAGMRLQEFAVGQCGPGVQPNPQQLADFS